jgi:hypothetical protein
MHPLRVRLAHRPDPLYRNAGIAATDRTGADDANIVFHLVASLQNLRKTGETVPPAQTQCFDLGNAAVAARYDRGRFEG